jgi:DNA-binding CsgD family transcriptional regulator
MVRLSAADLDALRLFQEDHICRAPDDVPVSVEAMDELRRLIPCELASYCELDYAERRPVCQVDCSDEPPADEAHDFGPRYWDATWNSAISAHQRASRGAAAKLTDFYTLRELASTKAEVLRITFGLSGRWDVLSVDASDDRLRTKKLILAGSRTFRERDRTVLDLLRPILALRLSAAARRGEADARLTSRERDVMRLVALGRSNKEIAGQLWLSPATVGKHLEHVYEKLGVTNRTAAVAAMRG